MRSRLVEKLEWLVDIPSVTREEQEIADKLEARLREAGTHELFRWRHGILAFPKAQTSRLLMVGHLDTVPPSPEQTRCREGGRVYGCGTSDMKAGCAVMLELMEQLPDHNATYLFYDREEGPIAENGLKPLLDQVRTPGIPAIVLEPTNGEVQVGCVGSFHLMVEFHGVRAHAARPWQGRNALYMAVPLLDYLSKREPEVIIRDGQPFRQVITPTIIEGPDLRNAVPGRVSLNLNVRYAPGCDPQALIDEVKTAAGPDATVTLEDMAEAGEVCHTHPLLAPWIEERRLVVAPKQAWTDVAQLTANGFPAVNFGPGEPAQAHQPNEWCEEEPLVKCYQDLLALYKAVE